MRCIDKSGGVDSYILYTPEKVLNSKIGLELKGVLVKEWEKKNGRKFSARAEKYAEQVSHWEKRTASLSPLREAVLQELKGEVSQQQQTESE